MATTIKNKLFSLIKTVPFGGITGRGNGLTFLRHYNSNICSLNNLLKDLPKI